MSVQENESANQSNLQEQQNDGQNDSVIDQNNIMIINTPRQIEKDKLHEYHQANEEQSYQEQQNSQGKVLDQEQQEYDQEQQQENSHAMGEHDQDLEQEDDQDEDQKQGHSPQSEQEQDLSPELQQQQEHHKQPQQMELSDLQQQNESQMSQISQSFHQEQDLRHDHSVSSLSNGSQIEEKKGGDDSSIDNQGSPSQLNKHESEMNQDEVGENQERVRPLTEELELDTLAYYQKQEQEVIAYCKQNNCLWVDQEYPPDNRSLYKDQTKVPEWAKEIRTIKWLRPSEIGKDVKFMIDRDGDAKQGALGESWFIGSIVIISSISAKGDLLDKLFVNYDNFESHGFVTFQFFKNGEWRQVMVDTLLPYDPDSKQLLFSQCANPSEFWIPLMEKAYSKLHGNYETICEGTIAEGLVDLTGGVADAFSLQDQQTLKMIENDQLWQLLMNSFHLKFHLGCVNYVEGKGTKNADTGTHGILENHYYGIIDIREFQKEKLRLIRIRNVWGPEGGWNGAFCDDSEEWDKHRNLREELKLVFKSKKSDGTWWMAYNDWYTHFNRFFVCKVFPENWENYSIPSKWQGKTAGGVCPPKMQYTEPGNIPEYFQLDTDEKWFNNPQFKVKVIKETKMYISLMQEDEKLSKQPYIQCNFMVIANKARRNRIWERPTMQDIVVEANSKAEIPAQREVTQQFILKKFEGKNSGLYMIVPNMILPENKKEDKRNFFLRVFSSEPIEVTEMPETLEVSMEGTWADNTAGGKRKYDNAKDNPNWCKNPQYFLNLKLSTHLKIILRKTGNLKKAKGTRIGTTLCRFEENQQNKVKVQLNQPKVNSKTGGTNLARLLLQTQQQLEAPEMEQIERKLQVHNQEKFKESTYFSEEISALYFHFNPTEGPFIIIPSLDQEDKLANYKLTIFSNNPVELVKLDDTKNSVLIGKWEQDISDGGCHLYEDPYEKELSKRTWTMNPKFLLQFKDNQPVKLSVTLCIAEKNWKSKTKNTVGGMIGLYLIEKTEGKIAIEQVLRPPNFLPINQITEEFELKDINKQGYYIMPTTYQSKIYGQFIISVQADREFLLQAIK